MAEGGEEGAPPGVLRCLETRAPEPKIPDPLERAADERRVDVPPVRL
ncbi:MAG: hypothetical protein ACYTBS_21220 [Planctomycetota bacterium]